MLPFCFWTLGGLPTADNELPEFPPRAGATPPASGLGATKGSVAGPWALVVVVDPGARLSEVPRVDDGAAPSRPVDVLVVAVAPGADPIGPGRAPPAGLPLTLLAALRLFMQVLAAAA